MASQLVQLIKALGWVYEYLGAIIQSFIIPATQLCFKIFLWFLKIIWAPVCLCGVCSYECRCLQRPQSLYVRVRDMGGYWSPDVRV